MEINIEKVDFRKYHIIRPIRPLSLLPDRKNAVEADDDGEAMNIT